MFQFEDVRPSHDLPLMPANSDRARKESVIERLSRVSPAELAAVDRELIGITRLRQSLGQAVDAAFASGQCDVVGGFEPFPHRGGKVTDELTNRLREDDIY